MSISVCAISGSPLVHAVISIKTGHLFEKSVIVKHLNSFPYCPVTNQPLSIEDLIDVKGCYLSLYSYQYACVEFVFSDSRTA
jgi:hypothetical protein